MIGRILSAGAFAMICASGIAQGAAMLKSVPLPNASGAVSAMAFSPDSHRLAILRHINTQNASSQRDDIQILDLNNGNVVSQTELPPGEWSNKSLSTRFIVYSFDGRYLLVATSGTDVLLILRTDNLQVANRVILHPQTQHGRSLSAEGKLFFQGIVGIAVAPNADVFGALTHDDQGTNELFVGSVSSGQISNSWSLGHGTTFGGLGRISLAFRDDGTRVAVSVLPDGNKIPKDFLNLRVYSSSGRELMAVRTDGLLGKIVLLPDDSILAARIATPGLFSKKLCIEKWNPAIRSVTGHFCDPGRHIISLGVSKNYQYVAGSACQIHKDLEGNLYSVPGRIDVWDAEAGTLAAYSDEFTSLGPADIQMSANGSWLVANNMLFATGLTPNGRE